jgi:hypothetical protein
MVLPQPNITNFVILRHHNTQKTIIIPSNPCRPLNLDKIAKRKKNTNPIRVSKLNFNFISKGQI